MKQNKKNNALFAHHYNLSNATVDIMEMFSKKIQKKNRIRFNLYGYLSIADKTDGVSPLYSKALWQKFIFKCSNPNVRQKKINFFSFASKINTAALFEIKMRSCFMVFY